MELQTADFNIVNELKRDLSPTFKELQLTPKGKVPKVQEEFKCTECEFTTTKKLLFKKHCIMNHSDKLDTNLFSASQYKCDFCEKVFKDPIQLSNHKNVHLGIKPYKCVECEHMFTTRGELIRHTRYKHTLERPHKCTICDYSSVELSKLKRHIRVHTDERPYLCPYCDYASRDTFKLKRHIRVHTGEKPYECPICKTCFNQSNSLKVHMKCSHSEGSRIQKKNARSESKKEADSQNCPEKSLTDPLKLPINSVSVAQTSPIETRAPLKSTYFLSTDNAYYSNENYIKNAQQISKSPKDCETISPNNSTSNSHFIQTEMILNEETNIFSCQECSMKFTSKEAMDEHHVKHTGERPYECNICNMRFGQKFALRSHIQSHDEVHTEKLKSKLRLINESTASTTQQAHIQSFDINSLPHTPLNIDPIETQRSDTDEIIPLQTAEFIEIETSFNTSFIDESLSNQKEERLAAFVTNINESIVNELVTEENVEKSTKSRSDVEDNSEVFEFRKGDRKKTIQSVENSFVNMDNVPTVTKDNKNYCELCPKVYFNKTAPHNFYFMYSKKGSLVNHLKRAHNKGSKTENKAPTAVDSERKLKEFITRLNESVDIINNFASGKYTYETYETKKDQDTTNKEVNENLTNTVQAHSDCPTKIEEAPAESGLKLPIIIETNNSSEKSLETNNTSENVESMKKSESFVSIYDRSELNQTVDSSIKFTLLEKTPKKKKASWNKRTSHQANDTNENLDEPTAEPVTKKRFTPKKATNPKENDDKTSIELVSKKKATPKKVIIPKKDVDETWTEPIPKKRATSKKKAIILNETPIEPIPGKKVVIPNEPASEKLITPNENKDETSRELVPKNDAQKTPEKVTAEPQKEKPRRNSPRNSKSNSSHFYEFY